MKAILKVLLILILLVVILVGSIAAVLYFTFFNVKSAEYPFLQEKSKIVSIEYAQFTFTENGLSADTVGVIVDTDAFMADLKSAECHTGINVNNFLDLINGKPINGIVINYEDGNFEFITPYICINSSINPKTVMDLLNTKIYGYDPEVLQGIVDKHGFEIPDEILDGIEDLDKID